MWGGAVPEPVAGFTQIGWMVVFWAASCRDCEAISPANASVVYHDRRPVPS
jgi:hypothetical protein